MTCVGDVGAFLRVAVVLASAVVIVPRAFRPGVVLRVVSAPCVCVVLRASVLLGLEAAVAARLSNVGGAAVWGLAGLALAMAAATRASRTGVGE